MEKLDEILTNVAFHDCAQFAGAQTPPQPLGDLTREVQEPPVAVLNKKESVYRPLMRLFRRYFRKDALSQREYDSIHEHPLQEQGLLFADALGVPHALWAQPRTQHALLLLIDSHRIMRKKMLVPLCQATMGIHLPDIHVPFFTAFNECSLRHRKRFFSDPLV